MSQKSRFLFGNKNYLILILSILLICLGFVLMIGGGGVGDSDFIPEMWHSIKNENSYECFVNEKSR